MSSPIEHNTYFDGNVQSMSLMTDEGRATIGIMKPGKYTFNTKAEERIEIVQGAMMVKLPDEEWETHGKGETINIPEDSSFDVRVGEDVAYICYYGEFK